MVNMSTVITFKVHKKYIFKKNKNKKLNTVTPLYNAMVGVHDTKARYK